MLFWTLFIVMVLAAITFIAFPLLRKRGSTTSDIDHDKQNVLIAREVLSELKAQFESGHISQDEFIQSKLETERLLIDDLDNTVDKKKRPILNAAWTFAASSLLITFLTIGLYFQLGVPNLVDVNAAELSIADEKAPSLNEMAETLNRRLVEYPEDKQAWYFLGRTYMALNDFESAVTALEKLYQISQDDPALLITLADATALRNGGILKGRPTDLIRSAVSLAPDDPKVLWFAGKAEAENNNLELAIKHWSLLKSKLPEDNEATQIVAKMIEEAKTGIGLKANETGRSDVSSSKNVSVQLRISVDEALKGRIDQNATVFVYAKAIKGPKMPLAAIRLKVIDLPTTVTLDDSMAVIPSMRLSSQNSVVVGALLSSSGVANGVTGDLRGEVFPVVVAQSNTTKLIIDTVIQ